MNRNASVRAARTGRGARGADGARAPGATPRGPHGAVVGLLACTAAYPVALAAHPPTEALAWPLVIALLVGLAAALAARHRGRGGEALQRSQPHPSEEHRALRRGLAVAGLVVAGGAVDVLVRALLRLATGASVDGTIAGGATVVVGAMVLAAWAGGAWLTTTAAVAVHGSGDVRPAGQGLLAAGCVVVLATGVVQWGAPAAGWQPLTAAFAATGYAAVALLHLQGLRRAALVRQWGGTGRAVHPGIVRSWTTWVTLLLLAAVVAVSLWFTPPARPARDGVERAAPEAVDRALEFIGLSALTRQELTRGGRQVAGESMPVEPPGSTEDERRQIRIRGLLEWLLPPAEGGPAGELQDRDATPPLRWGVTPQLLVVLSVLVMAVFLLVAYLAHRRVRRDGGGAGPWGQALRVLAAAYEWLRRQLRALLGRPEARRPVLPVRADDPAPPRRQRRRARRWLRPSDPRAQVRFDYRRVLDQAQRQGVGRRPDETPREYARTLAATVPEEAGRVEVLTEHFVTARYSSHQVAGADAERTKEASRRLRSALRRREPAERG